MSVYLTLGAVVAVALGQAALVDASTPGQQPRQAEGRSHTPEGAVFVGGFAGPGGTERWVVEVFTIRDDRDPAGTPRPLIPIARRAYETPQGQGDALWADGRTCPRLYDVMRTYARIPPPLFRAPPLTDPVPVTAPPSSSQAIHGAEVSVWGFADQADGGFMFMTLTGETGILDQWVRWANDQLNDCWRSGEPPRLTD